MAADSSFARAPAPAEKPTRYAMLRIQVRRVRPRGTAKRRIPPDQMNYTIMTCGVLVSVAMGTAGVVHTLRVDPRRPGLALAELILAGTAVAIIAAGSRSRERRVHGGS